MEASWRLSSLPEKECETSNDGRQASRSLEYLSLQSVGNGDPRCKAELEKCLAVNLGEQLVATFYFSHPISRAFFSSPLT